MHLAELNIAVPRYPLDDPRIAGFMDNVGRINAVGETMPGFVWMLRGEGVGATGVETPWPGAIVNMSVWQTPEQLEHFVWNTVHKRFYERKAEWFTAMQSHHFVMWWVDEGHVPTLAEAKDRLDYLDRHGNTDHAFGWSHLPHVKLWKTQRCG